MTDKKAPSTDLSAMSDEELDALATDLAKKRTDIRLLQNAVSTEQQLRTALAGMSGPAREAILLRLSGGITPEGAQS